MLYAFVTFPGIHDMEYVSDSIPVDFILQSEPHCLRLSFLDSGPLNKSETAGHLRLKVNEVRTFALEKPLRIESQRGIDQHQIILSDGSIVHERTTEASTTT